MIYFSAQALCYGMFISLALWIIKVGQLVMYLAKSPNYSRKVLETMLSEILLFTMLLYIPVYLTLTINHQILRFDEKLSNGTVNTLIGLFELASTMAPSLVEKKELVLEAIFSKEQSFEMPVEVVKGMRQALFGITPDNSLMPILTLEDNNFLQSLNQIKAKEILGPWLYLAYSTLFSAKALDKAAIITNIISSASIDHIEFARCLKIFYYASKVYMNIVNVSSLKICYGKDIPFTIEDFEKLSMDTWVVPLCYCREILYLCETFFDTTNVNLEYFYEHSYSLNDLDLDDENQYKLPDNFIPLKEKLK